LEAGQIKISKVGSLKIAICIPVRNERSNLHSLLRELDEVAGQLVMATVVAVVFDDSSGDGTVDSLQYETFSNFETLVCASSAHVGKSVGLSKAFDLALSESCDFVVMMDGDGQDDPAELRSFIDALLAGSDVVNGRRIKRQDDSLKILASQLFNMAARLVTGVQLRDVNSGYKGFSRRAASLFRQNLRGDLHRLIVPMATSLDLRVTETTVTNRKRLGGKSKYGYRRGFNALADLALFGLIGFDKVEIPKFFVWSAILSPILLFATVFWLVMGSGGTLWLVGISNVILAACGLTSSLLIVRLQQLRKQNASSAEVTYRCFRNGASAREVSTA